MIKFAFETARLTLRPFRPDDLDVLHELWTEAGVRRYLWDDEIIPRETAEAVIKASVDSFTRHGFGFWALSLKTDASIIGFCGLRFIDDTEEVELLYGLKESFWGRGLATEAAREVIRHGFDRCEITRISAITDAQNAASVRVMEKAGMTFEKRGPHHGLDSSFYSISHDQFRSAR